MSYFLKVLKKDANSIKSKLVENNLFDRNFKPISDVEYVYFPILVSKSDLGEVVVKSSSSYQKKTKSLKEIFNNLNLELNETISSYDTVGDIAILKIPKELEQYEKMIAKELLNTNPKLKTIVKKFKDHGGIYRIQKVKYLAGRRSFLTTVKEANCLFKVKLSDMFFSPRLSHERLRFAKMIRDDSIVSVFFSGVAPFSIVAAKLSKAKKIYSIELNPKAHILALQNIKLNNLDNVFAINDDVVNFAKEHPNEADYIAMPLPKDASKFLESAFIHIKKNTGIISLYEFVKKDDLYTNILKEIDNFAKLKGYRVEVLFKRKVRDFSSSIDQIVIDFKFCNI